jgi:hypothetical protein
MGTLHKGFVGKPQLFMITVGKDDQLDFVRRLRDLPAKIHSQQPR